MANPLDGTWVFRGRRKSFARQPWHHLRSKSGSGCLRFDATDSATWGLSGEGESCEPHTTLPRALGLSFAYWFYPGIAFLPPPRPPKKERRMFGPPGVHEIGRGVEGFLQHMAGPSSVTRLKARTTDFLLVETCARRP